MGNELYVDGGVRENLALQAALDLGASNVYAIVASKLGPEPQHTYEHNTAWGSLMRSLKDLALDEVVYNESVPPPGSDGWGQEREVHIIAPSINLHDVMVIDPGLISISMAYGYMRAADVITGVDRNSETWLLADKIVELRKRIWSLECVMNGKPTPGKSINPAHDPVPDLADDIASWKQELRTLIGRRRQLGGKLPAEADSWWQIPERHPWQVDRRLSVSVEPRSIPLSVPIDFIVRAVEPQTNAPVAGGGIKIDGQEVGAANSAHRFEFNTSMKPVFDPILKVWIPKMATPTGEVSAPGYADTPIPFLFHQPKLRVWVEPSRIPAGQSVEITVRAVDAENGTPLGGTVRIGDQQVGRRNVPFAFVLSPSGASGTVSVDDDEYPPATLTLVAAERRINATVAPAPKWNVAGTYTVVAKDANSGANVQGKATLTNPGSGAREFPTNTSFPFTFVWKAGTRIDPRPKFTTGTVSADGYPGSFPIDIPKDNLPQ